MNKKRFLLTTIAVFVFIFIFDMLFHGHYMADMYIATRHLWRPEAEMQQLFPLMLAGQFLVALMFSFLFAKGYEGRGVMEGVRFGIYIALLLAGPHLIMHVVSDDPTIMTASWLVGSFLEFIGAGAVASLVYRA